MPPLRNLRRLIYGSLSLSSSILVASALDAFDTPRSIGNTPVPLLTLAFHLYLLHLLRSALPSEGGPSDDFGKAAPGRRFTRPLFPSRTTARCCIAAQGILFELSLVMGLAQLALSPHLLHFPAGFRRATMIAQSSVVLAQALVMLVVTGTVFKISRNERLRRCVGAEGHRWAEDQCRCEGCEARSDEMSAYELGDDELAQEREGGYRAVPTAAPKIVFDASRGSLETLRAE